LNIPEGEITLKAEERLLTIPHACRVDVGAGGTVVDTVDVAVAIQLHALEMRNSALPT